MKVAVVGAESSGTRLMTRILTAAGCQTLHRSFPYGPRSVRRWPTVEVREYAPEAIVWMVRDPAATVESQVAAGHVPSIGHAWANLQIAPRRIMAAIGGARLLVVPYESLVQRPDIVVRNVCDWLTVPVPAVEPITDGNAKYLGEAA